MEVLIASRCLPWPLVEGDRLILHHLVRELTARGHGCDIVAFGSADEGRESLTRSASVCRELRVVGERRRSRWQYLARLARPFPRAADGAWNPEMWRAVEERLAARRYDVAHVFGGSPVYELRHLVTRIPAIIAPYESYSLLLERAGADASDACERVKLRAALAVARRYERVMFRGYSRVVVLTDRDRDTLLRLAPDLPVAVIPNGVRANATAPAPADPPELLFVGNFGYAPNVRAATRLVRDVLPRVRRRRPDVRVVLVGAGPPPAVEALAKAQGVALVGQVPDVAPFLARAAALVAPITQGAGMKNKILEAMAAGRPVVTTPMGCDGIAAVDGVHVLLGTGADALADAVLAVLEAPELGERIGRQGRALVDARYAWGAVAASYEALYAAVVGEEAGG
jgi:glycosyltransferase involved in cell wall biosynthesis